MRWFGFGFGAEAPPAAAPFTGRSFCRSGFSREQPRTRTKFLAKPFGAEAPPTVPFAELQNIPTYLCWSRFSRQQPRIRTKFLAKPFGAEAPPAVPFAELQNIPTNLCGSVFSRERRHLANIHTMPHAHSHRLRTHRFSRVGRGYLLTTVTRNRAPVFRDFASARLAIAELRTCDTIGLSSTLAYVLMPDHLHWLVQLRAGTLSDLMRRFKSCSAASVNHSRGSQGQALWQPGFHDRAVRDGQDPRTIARYIIENPLRAGLADSIGDYPHWDVLLLLA